MKPKYISIWLFVLSLFLVNEGNSQSLIVDYVLETNFLGNIIHESYYSVNSPVGKVDTLYEKEIVHANTQVQDVKGAIAPFVAFDNTSGQMTYAGIYFNKACVVQEPAPVFDWTLLDTTRQVLGMICNAATTHFRGRDYTVWYTDDVGLYGGIYKFSGLPGYILAAYSTDGMVSFEAKSIRKSQESLNVTSFLEKQRKPISYELYKQEFDQLIERFKRYMKANEDEDTTYELTINLVEEV